MVDAIQHEENHCFYTPARIDRWLQDWDLLLSLAETPRSSRHYLTLEHRYLRDRPCSTDQHLEQRGNAYHGDALSYADIQADIESAIAALELPAFRIVYLVQQGMTFREIGDLLRVGTMTAHRIYRQALEAMTAHLESGGLTAVVQDA